MTPDFPILYVDDPLKSADLYGRILGRPAIEASPTFAMFVFANGMKLGLWSRADVKPAVTVHPGGSELSFTVENAARVDAIAAEWRAMGQRIAQDPVDLPFGHSFVGLDPDGHRLRVYCPAGAA